MSPDTGGGDGAVIKYRNIHRLINGYKKGLVCFQSKGNIYLEVKFLKK